jgi:alkanesulfonate monooxygenase SsuD/methylene tetrahydromethanopterin reductase-like flavin-dependent oxidoreductase (luciferase family)
MEPKPVQQPHPPIWFGGSHPNALARAVRDAHGFIGAGSSTTAAFAPHARIVRDQLHQQRALANQRLQPSTVLVTQPDHERTPPRHRTPTSTARPPK